MKPRFLTSRDNPVLKTIRLVASQARRAPADLVLAEGLRTLEEATGSAFPIQAVVVAEHFGSSEREKALLALWGDRNIEPYRVPEALLRYASEVATPQGAVALVRVPPARLQDMRPGIDPLILAVSGVQDPGNLGTLLRTAVAAGCSMVCCLEGTVSARNPKVIRASAGAFFHIPLVEAAASHFFGFCRSERIAVFAGSAHEGSLHTTIDLKKACAILLGNEGSGIPGNAWPQAGRIRIPLAPGVESLNVAVAGAILMFEARRQRTAVTELQSGKT